MPIRPHAFVAMPFGEKPGPDGQLINFNRVYTELIGPALEAAELSVFRADQEQRAGDIKTDMFQELLVADLVVADLTIDNPNVWYELGVRHALRPRGVVLICGGRTTTAFDLYSDRKLRYGVAGGGPDPATLEHDRRALTEMVKKTMESWHGRKVSPVYHLLPHLQEPEWKKLRIGDVREFWEQHEQWERRIDRARKSKLIGDLLVLADEAPVAAFRADAWIRAGAALRRAKRFTFAIEQLERGLAVEPTNHLGLTELGICLQRCGLDAEPGHSLDRARDHYRAALELYPGDPELSALLGRVDKDAWTAAWRRPDFSAEQRREEAAYQDALLDAAIESYGKGFRARPSHYYSGINALMLMHLQEHLTPGKRTLRELTTWAGAVRFAAENERTSGQSFWAKATLGDVEVVEGTVASIREAYKKAIASNEADWFALDSTRDQLVMLQEVGFRPEEVTAGIATFDRALAQLKRPEQVADWEPRQVFLFSGHMIDAPDRKVPRFPTSKEDAARQRIEAALDKQGAGPQDLAFAQAAAGGDILFMEACQKRGVRCQILLPFPEPDFIQSSVLRSADGPRWSERFYAVTSAPNTTVRVMPTELGPLPKSIDPYERCNMWLLYTALACGIKKLRFISLWNGEAGDGKGGSKHMLDEVKRRTGRIDWIDSRTL